MKRVSNRTTRRSVAVGAAALVSVGAVLVGASVTSAAIDTAAEVPPADAIVEAAVVEQADDGSWYSCTVDLGEEGTMVAPVPVGEVGELEASGTVAVGDVQIGELIVGEPGATGAVGGEAIELSEGDLDELFAGVVPGAEPGESVTATGGAIAVEVSGDAGLMLELPEPDDIREGTAEECSALLGE